MHLLGSSWQQANDYCQWLGEQVGIPMNLPKEAHWEYAQVIAVNTLFTQPIRASMNDSNYYKNLHKRILKDLQFNLRLVIFIKVDCHNAI